MSVYVCLCIIIEAVIKQLLNSHTGYHSLGAIITMLIGIVINIHSHVCQLYAGLLIVFQAAVMLRYGEKLLQMI